MVLLCFLLDLRTLSPSLLRDLKQCLLQLANFYAISSGRDERQSEVLRDRIGLCYVQKNRMSCSDELKIAYSPKGNFSLRDFHHAVNNLPNDAFLPEMIDLGAVCGGDVEFARLLSNEVLFSWGSKDIIRKVTLITSFLEEISPIMRKTLMDAADKCVSVEFVLLEKELSLHNDISEKIKEFVNSICDLENCSLQTCLPDTWVLSRLVRRWLQNLKGDLEEPLQAAFLFKSNLLGSVNQIFCNLFASVNQIVDGFSSSQMCRCHGVPVDSAVENKTNRTSCPVTCHELEQHDLIENTVKVGEHTILFLPSFRNCPKLQRVPLPIVFNVIELTNLAALSEVFQGICQALHSLDQGLVCSSNCNIETMREATFHCFYILQPSDKGLMLLRRLAGSEEILPVPDTIQPINSAVPKEIEISIQLSLSRMELSDYNPLMHERGFHSKLNLLVKESLQFGSIPPKRPKQEDTSSEPNSPEPEPFDAMVQIPSTEAALEVEEKPLQLIQATEEDDTAAFITEEWEQLIVNEVPVICSPICISRPKMEKSVQSPSDTNKPLDEKTSRILERLEAPRQLKTKLSPSISVKAEAFVPMTKQPLVPFRSNHATHSQGSIPTQPIKPNFQRLKRKQR